MGIAGTAPPGTEVVADGIAEATGTAGIAGEAAVGVKPTVVAAGTATDGVGFGA